MDTKELINICIEINKNIPKKKEYLDFIMLSESNWTYYIPKIKKMRFSNYC